MNGSESSAAWWTTFFDDRFAELVLRRDPARVHEDLDRLVDLLELRPCARVLDQCCGVGTLALPLATRGHTVIGVDRTASYVERARREAESSKIRCEFHVADASTFVPTSPCDAAFNWRTSFGYHRDDRRNVALIERAFASLRPGGIFALDYGCLPGVLRSFQPCLLERFDTEDGEIMVLRESTLDLVDGLLHQIWTYVLPGGARTVREGSTRLYMPHQLREMLEQSGFVDVRLRGGLSETHAEISLDSPRCIAVGRRP